MCAYRKAILTIGMQFHCVPFGPFRFHSANKQMAVGIDFIFSIERAIYSSFMKISVPSPVFRGKTKRWKWNFAKYTRSECQQGENICFRNNKIRESDTLERQTIGVNKYASTFRWLHAIRKGLITEKKTRRKKIWKYASTQLRITRLRKYPIDPKAYLGRWIKLLNFLDPFHACYNKCNLLSHLLIYFGYLYCKQYGLGSGCSIVRSEFRNTIRVGLHCLLWYKQSSGTWLY